MMKICNKFDVFKIPPWEEWKGGGILPPWKSSNLTCMFKGSLDAKNVFYVYHAVHSDAQLIISHTLCLNLCIFNHFSLKNILQF